MRQMLNLLMRHAPFTKVWAALMRHAPTKMKVALDQGFNSCSAFFVIRYVLLAPPSKKHLVVQLPVNARLS